MIDLEHPEIARTNRTGYPKPIAKQQCCPKCGEDIDSETIMYVTDNFEPVGCENCVTRIGAWQYFNDKEESV